MARMRMLKPGFFKNELLAAFSPSHRLLFQGLWLLADRAGRLDDRPRRIHAEIFPYEQHLDVDTMLTELADGEEPFITRYTVAGKRHIQVNGFVRHQRPDHREPDSTIPEISDLAVIANKTVKPGHVTVLPTVEQGNAEGEQEQEQERRWEQEQGQGWDADRARVGTLAMVPPTTTAMAKPAPIINGAEQRRHGTHAWCSWPERDGLCVPYTLHKDFVGKLGRPTADRELREWYPSVVARYAGRAIGDDIFKFWNNELGAWIGTVTSPPINTATKGNASVAAMERVLAQRNGGRA